MAAQQLSVWHCSCGATSVKVDIAPTEFGDTAAIDLFVLADYPGHLHPAGTFGVVIAAPRKHPQICVGSFLPTLHCSVWCASQTDFIIKEESSNVSFRQELEDKARSTAKRCL